MSAQYPVLVQHVVARSAGSAAFVTTGAITTVSGDLAVVCVTCDSNHIGASPTVISDSKGNTYLTAVAGPGATHGAAIFYVPNMVGGASHTFTFTPTASDFLTITVSIIRNAALAPLGNTNSTRANSTTHSSGNVTTGAESILIGVGSSSQTNEGVPVITQGNTWLRTDSQAADSTHEGFVAGERAAASGVTDQFTYTVAAATDETACVAEFRGLAASGGGASSHSFIGMLG